MTDAQILDISKRCMVYIVSIRNVDKRRYALQYADYARSFLPTGHPEFAKEPERPATLSYMAAQAVRMAIDGIVHG